MRVLIILIFSSAVELPRTTSRIASCIVVITFLPQTHRLLNHAWWMLLSRHSPDSRRFAVRITSLTGLGNSKSCVARVSGDRRLLLPAPKWRSAIFCLRQCMFLPSVACRACALRGSCSEHLLQDCNLGHLGRDVAPMADKLGADLDQFLAQAGQQSWLRRLGHCQRAHEVTEAVEGDDALSRPCHMPG
jgi:hypothetical protein